MLSFPKLNLTHPTHLSGNGLDRLGFLFGNVALCHLFQKLKLALPIHVPGKTTLRESRMSVCERGGVPSLLKIAVFTVEPLAVAPYNFTASIKNVDRDVHRQT